MATRIGDRGAQNVGLARSEALSRGLEGDPYEASAVGRERAATSGQLADLDADIGYKTAGLQREERLTGEGRQYQSGENERSRAFTAAESEKNRNFQERLARLGYDQQRDMEAVGNRREYQRFIRDKGYDSAVGGAKALAMMFGGA